MAFTFEQGRNELKIGQELLSNVVTQNKDLPEKTPKIDLLISLNYPEIYPVHSVCYVKDGQAIGVARASRAGFTAPAWRATKRIFGICGSIPRCCLYPSSRTSAVPTGIIPSTLYFRRLHGCAG